METAEHARRRVFKGIVGRKHSSHYELAARGARRTREAERDALYEQGSRQAAVVALAVNSLAKLCDPKQIAKRRKRRGIEI